MVLNYVLKQTSFGNWDPEAKCSHYSWSKALFPVIVTQALFWLALVHLFPEPLDGCVYISPVHNKRIDWAAVWTGPLWALSETTYNNLHGPKHTEVIFCQPPPVTFFLFSDSQNPWTSQSTEQLHSQLADSGVLMKLAEFSHSTVTWAGIMTNVTSLSVCLQACVPTLLFWPWLWPCLNFETLSKFHLICFSFIGS